MISMNSPCIMVICILYLHDLSGQNSTRIIINRDPPKKLINMMNLYRLSPTIVMGDGGKGSGGGAGQLSSQSTQLH